MQQELEQQHLFVGFPQRFNPQRPQGAQIPFNRTAIMSHFRDLTVATGVGGRSLAGRKPDLAPLLQLQQQRAAGHVLEPPLLVAPVPSFAQIPRQSASVPRRVLREQITDQSNLTPPDGASLNDLLHVHRRQKYDRPGTEFRKKSEKIAASGASTSNAGPQDHPRRAESAKIRTAVLGLANIDTTTAGGKLVFGIFAALAEFERELIRECTKAGLVAARVRGRKGGRKFSMTKAQVRLAQAAMGKQETRVADLCNELRITRATLYRYVGPNGDLREHGRQVLGVAP